jgi:hypothetical protein
MWKRKMEGDFRGQDKANNDYWTNDDTGMVNQFFLIKRENIGQGVTSKALQFT